MTNLNFPVNRKQECKNCAERKGNIFCDLPEKALELLDKSKVVNFYKRGQFVFYAGNFPSGLYCVSSGVVKLETEGAGGNGHILRVVKGGGVLGYRSLFADEPYEAAAVVHEEASICLIPKPAVTELLAAYPDVGMKLLSVVSKELKAAEGRLCGQTDKNASERVAEAVVFLREKFPTQVWTRKEIAEWAGTTPETVMRTLSDFEERGLIEQVGRKINIINKQALVKEANLIF